MAFLILFSSTRLNTLLGIDSRVIPLQLEHELKSPFSGSLMSLHSFHSSGICSSSHIFLNSLCSISVLVVASAFKASDGILSGPAALPFFNCLIALIISCFVGVLHSISKSCSAGSMFKVCCGASRLRSYFYKCSIHLFS